MNRRHVILLGGSLALRPLAVAAQPSVPVLGFLFVGNPQRSAYWTDAWAKAMGEAGYVEGRHFAAEYRWADGDPAKLPAFAADLVNRRVAVIITAQEQAVMAAKQATSTIPIVFNYIFDPVGKGLVQSVAKPGGNITGVAIWEEGVMESKRLQLFHQAIPFVSRLGYLVAEQDVAPRRRTIDAVVTAGKTLGVEIIVLTAGTADEIDPAVGKAKKRGVRAVLVQSPSTLLYAQQKRVLAAGRTHGMLLASGLPDFAIGGGLMEYAGVLAEVPRLTAGYVARILKGQNVADLPVQQTNQFKLTLNLKTANTLGLTFPPALLGTADEVIE